MFETENELAEIGEPILVCRTSRRTLVGGYVLASLPCGFGATILTVLCLLREGDWTKDVLGTVLFLLVAGGAFFGGWKLWRKTNRLRSVRVTVAAEGLSYRDRYECIVCRWDQVQNISWKSLDHYEVSHIYLGGVARVPWSESREYSHSTHVVKVLRKDGVLIVLTDELENITGLARLIVEGAEQSRQSQPHS